MKNKKTISFLCAMSFAMALTLSACNSGAKNNKQSGSEEGTTSESQGGEETLMWTVTFDSQGGSAVAAKKVENGKTVAKPTDPTRSEYSFDGWFEEKDAITPFNFSTPITSNWTLYAGWTYQGGGEVDPPEPPEPPVTSYDFYVSLEDNVYGASKQSYDLLPTQTAEYRVDVGNIVEGQSIAILNSEKVALSDNYGAEPGDNNVSGEVGSFTIHNSADDAFVIIKTWESGWTNFYVSGYQDGSVTPPDPVEDSYYVTIGDAEYELVKDDSASLVTNQKGQYVANIASVSKDAAVVFYDPQKTAITEGIGSDPEDAENKNNIVVGDGFKIHNDAENVTVYFKTWEDGGHSFWITGYESSEVLPPDPENTITIYFRDASWWNKDAASTNYVAWTGEQPSGLGQMMTHLEWVEIQGFNYWSCNIDENAEYIMFFRTGGINGSDDWGARTVAVSLTERAGHNMYDISATSAQWYGEGHSVTGVWADYAA